MDLYIAGHIIEDREEDPGPVWDILGVFDLDYLAEQACYDDTCFVGPLELNQVLPKEILQWPGAYFPKNEQDERG